MPLMERQTILKFENHLANATITEIYSLLMSQLASLDPRGATRRPPPSVVDQLRQLHDTLSKSFTDKVRNLIIKKFTNIGLQFFIDF